MKLLSLVLLLCTYSSLLVNKAQALSTQFGANKDGPKKGTLAATFHAKNQERIGIINDELSEPEDGDNIDDPYNSDYLELKFNLSQSDDDDDDSVPTDEIDYDNMNSYELAQLKFDAFSRGLDADVFAANFTNCGDFYLELQYVQWPVYKIKLEYADFGDYFYNSTLITMNVTDMLFYCTDTVQNLNEYQEYEQERFGTMTAYITGFMQNLLANVIRLNNIYTQIDDSLAQKDVYAVWYYYGRILNIMLNFDPIEDLVNDPLMASRYQSNDFIDLQQDNQDTGNQTESGMDELKSVTGIVDFISGFLNGTDLLSEASNITGCEKIIDEQYIAQGYWLKNYTSELEIFNLLYTTYAMAYNVDALARTCSMTGTQAYDQFLLMIEISNEPRRIIDNFVHNFGNLYDTWRDVKNMLFTQVRGDQNQAFDIGFGLGKMVWYLIGDDTLATDEAYDPWNDTDF